MCTSSLAHPKSMSLMFPLTVINILAPLISLQKINNKALQMNEAYGRVIQLSSPTSLLLFLRWWTFQKSTNIFIFEYFSKTKKQKQRRQKDRIYDRSWITSIIQNNIYKDNVKTMSKQLSTCAQLHACVDTQLLT